MLGCCDVAQATVWSTGTRHCSVPTGCGNLRPQIVQPQAKRWQHL